MLAYIERIFAVVLFKLHMYNYTDFYTYRNKSFMTITLFLE